MRTRGGRGQPLATAGMLQLVPSSRFTKQPELIAHYEVTTPLWPAHTIVINPREPRTEEANGSEAAHPFVSVVGAAWLLMGQPGVTETRAIADSPTPRPLAAGATPDVAATPTVTIVELRRAVSHFRRCSFRSTRRHQIRWAAGGRTLLCAACTCHRWRMLALMRLPTPTPNCLVPLEDCSPQPTMTLRLHALYRDNAHFPRRDSVATQPNSTTQWQLSMKPETCCEG